MPRLYHARDQPRHSFLIPEDTICTNEAQITGRNKNWRFNE